MLSDQMFYWMKQWLSHPPEGLTNEPAAADIAAARVHHGLRETDRHSRIHGIAAALEDPKGPPLNQPPLIFSTWVKAWKEPLSSPLALDTLVHHEKNQT